MIENILWDRNAVFEGTQGADAREDCKESVRQTPREGSAWHRRGRPDEGCRPDAWRVLCAFSFARSPCDRGLHPCDGPFDGAMAKIVRGHRAREASFQDRDWLPCAAASR